jgi:hypothetical protein
MTVLDVILSIFGIGLVSTCSIAFLAIAFSLFEDTKLGEYLLEKLKKDDDEE